MKNKLMDLNNHLFAQLERLGDEDLSYDELKLEILRGKVISDVASQLVSNARVALEAHKFERDFGAFGGNDKLPEMIGSEDEL